jgi:hypothetical protein
MPLTIVAEVIIELGAELVVHAGKSTVDWVAEERRKAAAEAHRRALAAVDIVVLAALYDGVLTESERRALGSQIAKLMEKSPEETDAGELTEEVVERWTAWRPAASERELRESIAVRAASLEPSTKERVFEAVRRVVSTEERAPSSAYRSNVRPSPEATLRVFAEVLAVRP